MRRAWHGTHQCARRRGAAHWRKDSTGRCRRVRAARQRERERERKRRRQRVWASRGADQNMGHGKCGGPGLLHRRRDRPDAGLDRSDGYGTPQRSAADATISVTGAASPQRPPSRRHARDRRRGDEGGRGAACVPSATLLRPTRACARRHLAPEKPHTRQRRLLAATRALTGPEPQRDRSTAAASADRTGPRPGTLAGVAHATLGRPIATNVGSRQR